MGGGSSQEYSLFSWHGRNLVIYWLCVTDKCSVLTSRWGLLWFKFWRPGSKQPIAQYQSATWWLETTSLIWTMAGTTRKSIVGLCCIKKCQYLFICTHKKMHVYGRTATQTIFCNFRICVKPSRSLLSLSMKLNCCENPLNASWPLSTNTRQSLWVCFCVRNLCITDPTGCWGAKQRIIFQLETRHPPEPISPDYLLFWTDIE